MKARQLILRIAALLLGAVFVVFAVAGKDQPARQRLVTGALGVVFLVYALAGLMRADRLLATLLGMSTPEAKEQDAADNPPGRQRN